MTNRATLKIFRLFVGGTLFTASVIPASAGDIQGKPWTGPPGIVETVGHLMARNRHATAHAQGPVQSRIRPLLRQDRRGLVNDSNSISSTATSPRVATISESGPFTPQTVGTSFTGATLADKGLFPPDTMGTVGPTQFIVAVNNCFRTFNKATGLADGALNMDPDLFFASVKTPVGGSVIGNFTSDPHIRYDRLSGRWFIVMIDVPYTSASPFTTAPNRVMIAVSSGATITSQSSFTFFQFQNDTVGTTPNSDTGGLADYPTPGIDANALYIGVNVFNAAGTAYVDSTGFVVRKSSLLGAGPIVVTAFRGLATGSSDGPYTPQGVDNYDPAATEGYFIGVSSISYSRLVVRRVSTPGGTPSISGNLVISTATTKDPINVPHLGNTGGTNGYLDAVDGRLFAAHIRNGRLWTAHGIEVNSSGAVHAPGGRNGARWYELTNLTGTPAVNQWGTVFDSAATNPKSYWIPSIMVSGQGHVAMGFSTAGAANYANAGTVGRLAGDTLGTMQTPVDYTSCSTAYNPTGDPGSSNGRRWGDYSYTSLDPNDDMTMWTIQEFCNATNSYGVRVVRLAAPPPATPASCSPSTIVVGQTSVNVTITGTQSSGSGFFDPGAGFTNRIAAALSGGVVVNSITYSSPTSVTLNLNTAAASSGTKNVTITNPDGQSLTGTAILTVNPLAPVITSALTATGSSGLAFSYQIVATNSPTSYNATGRPANLVVDTSTGVISGIPAATGGTAITLSATNAGGTGTATLTLTVNTALENWRQLNFGTTANLGNAADTADPDRDGIQNLAEFGFGLNPNQNSAGLFPRPQIVGANFVATFNQPSGVTGITYGAEWSSTLAIGSWTSITDTGIAPQHIFSLPIGSTTKRFMRLKVSSP